MFIVYFMQYLYFYLCLLSLCLHEVFIMFLKQMYAFIKNKNKMMMMLGIFLVIIFVTVLIIILLSIKIFYGRVNARA